MISGRHHGHTHTNKLKIVVDSRVNLPRFLQGNDPTANLKIEIFKTYELLH